MIPFDNIQIGDLVGFENKTHLVTALAAADGWSGGHVCLDSSIDTMCDFLEPLPVTPAALVASGWFVAGESEASLKLPGRILYYYFFRCRLRRFVQRVRDEWDNNRLRDELTFEAQPGFLHELRHALILAGEKATADSLATPDRPYI